MRRSISHSMNADGGMSNVDQDKKGEARKRFPKVIDAGGSLISAEMTSVYSGIRQQINIGWF